MKNCELCRTPARTYCESDMASLCWDCDAKVHGANFLVARHSRTLLCHACQSPTPWKASGAALGNTVSVCRRCEDSGVNFSGDDGEESEGGNYTDMNNSDDDDGGAGGGDGGDDDGGGEVGGGDEHQVVPWSSSSTTPPPPASSSSSDESNNNCNRNNVSELGATLKRRRESHHHATKSNHNFQDGEGPSDGG